MLAMASVSASASASAWAENQSSLKRLSLPASFITHLCGNVSVFAFCSPVFNLFMPFTLIRTKEQEEEAKEEA